MFLIQGNKTTNLHKLMLIPCHHRSGSSTSSVGQNATIIAAALDEKAKHLIAVDDNKQLRVWDISASGELRLASTRCAHDNPGKFKVFLINERKDTQQETILSGVG
jgi:hypothetical protein